MNAHVSPAVMAPGEDTQTAAILRLAKDGVAQKQIAEQTGLGYAYVANVLWKLRQRGLIEKPEEIWTDAVLEALRVAIVVDRLKGTAAAARLTEQFGRLFTRDQVVGVALRRGWAAGKNAPLRGAKHPSRWTDDVVAALRAAIAGLLSASEAADQLTQTFGVEFSRNMVISKAKSLGLQFISEAKQPCGSRGARVARRPSRAVSKPKAAPIAFLEAEESWTPRRITLLELRDGVCRYPIGDPRAGAFAFCGAKTQPGKVYCGHCVCVAYETPAQRAATRRKWCEDRGLPVGRDWNGRQGSSV